MKDIIKGDFVSLETNIIQHGIVKEINDKEVSITVRNKITNEPEIIKGSKDKIIVLSKSKNL